MNTNCAWRNCECIYSQYKWGGAGADPTRARGGAHPGQVASLLQSQHRETNVQAPFHTDLYCLVLILIGCNGTQWSNGFCQIICTNLGEHWEKFNLVIALFTQRDDIARHYRKKNKIIVYSTTSSLLLSKENCWTFQGSWKQNAENSLHASLKWVHWPSLGLIDQSTEDLFFCLTAFVAGFDWLWQTNTLEFKKINMTTFEGWKLDIWFKS